MTDPSAEPVRPWLPIALRIAEALTAWRVISAGFTGILQVDGYSAYTSLVKTRAKSGSNETITLAGCWAHLRRRFYELHISGGLAGCDGFEARALAGSRSE